MKTTLLTLGTIIAFIAGSTLLTSCGSETNQDESTEHSHDGESMAAVFACSMHPEITGKEGDKCSKCGMALVASTDDHGDDMKDMDMSAMASCPMHPDITGKEGDKCSKCRMALKLAEVSEEGDTHQN